MHERILEVRNLSKVYSNFKLNNLNFQINKGDIIGLIGVNGAGKTTTIKLISGLILPTNGAISFFGKLMNTKNEQEIRNKLGFVFDENYFYETLTIKQMKEVFAAAYTNWDDKIFNSYLEKFNLPIDRKINQLSKGMKIKFSLALAFSHNAKFLVLDEPTSGLDPMIRKEILEILENFAKSGGSVLFSTHITSDLDKIATHLIIINKGEICLNDNASAIKKSYCQVTGVSTNLNKNTEKLFFYLEKSDDKFKGFSNNLEEVRKNFSSSKISEISFEDVMLQFIPKEEF